MPFGVTTKYVQQLSLGEFTREQFLVVQKEMMGLRIIARLKQKYAAQ